MIQGYRVTTEDKTLNTNKPLRNVLLKLHASGNISNKIQITLHFYLYIIFNQFPFQLLLFAITMEKSATSLKGNC